MGSRSASVWFPVASKQYALISLGLTCYQTGGSARAQQRLNYTISDYGICIITDCSNQYRFYKIIPYKNIFNLAQTKDRGHTN